MKKHNEFMLNAGLWLMGVSLGLLLGIVIRAIVTDGHTEPHGTVTEKLWTQAVWENGEQIIPPRFCLEIDDLTETCVPVDTFNKYKLGGQYP